MFVGLADFDFFVRLANSRELYSLGFEGVYKKNSKLVS